MSRSRLDSLRGNFNVVREDGMTWHATRTTALAEYLENMLNEMAERTGLELFHRCFAVMIGVYKSIL